MLSSRFGVNCSRCGSLLGVGFLILFTSTACKKTAKPEQPDNTPASPTVAAPITPNEKSGQGNMTPPKGGFSPSPAIPALTRPTLPEGWREFKHPEGAYAIYVPAQPKREKTSMSLKLTQPPKGNEARSSTYHVEPTATQPIGCTMEVMVFDASMQSGLEQSYANNPPKDNENLKVKGYREVTWAGRPAKEFVIETTYGEKRSYAVGRYVFTTGRVYQFNIRRDNEMPSNAELTAFYDSFIPGN